MALPFVIPRMVSGPDFPGKGKWRRSEEHAFVSFTDFVRGFARRVENPCHSDWTALPILRSVWYKYTANTAPMAAHYFGRRAGWTQDQAANEHVKAMQKLWHMLWHGFVGRGLTRVPVGGDTTRLPFADGLTRFEKQLARQVHYMAGHMPGSQAVRKLMGYAAHGGRVVYGDSLFLTISPNEEQSALVLHLIRNRRNDPMLQGPTAADAALRTYSGMHAPGLEANTADAHSLEVPCYELRRILAARDPRAVMEAYFVQIRRRLPWLLGMRMCSQCPKCNAETRRRPCQNRFGSNMLPMGGTLGGAVSMEAATEFQKKTSPHVHANIHLANAYQSERQGVRRRRLCKDTARVLVYALGGGRTCTCGG